MARIIVFSCVTLLLAHHMVAAFQGDAASRAVPQTKNVASTASEGKTLLPLGLIALWKLKPLIKSFNSYGSGFGSFGGTFGGTFGGGGYYPGAGIYPGAGFYPGFPGAASAAGVGFGGYPGAFPSVHPIGYPYPVVGGPGPFNIRGNKPVRTTQATVVEDGRVEVVDDPPAVTTTRPGFMQSLREFASPLLHGGQRIEARSQ